MTGGNCASMDASGDTRVEPWHGARPTRSWEGGVVDDGDGDDEVGGEADDAFGKTCLMESGREALKLGAVEGGG